MSDKVQITLEPSGRILSVARGEPLRELLFEHGVEYPCGGRARCRSCRVRVVGGHAEPTPEDRQALGERAVAEGWRLGCRLIPTTDLVLAVAQWQGPVLEDRTAVAVQPRPGLGVAIDLGTTTLVAQLVDLTVGMVLATEVALNPQGSYGADLISRMEASLRDDVGDQLRELIRRRLGEMIARLLEQAPAGTPLQEVILVGNTVMHHIFCGHALAPLAAAPFETDAGGLAEFKASELGWELAGNPPARFLPCLGSFVGSDILAGVLASGMGQADDFQALLDLGTNGEIVVGNAAGMLCASSAAGPAFEGARIVQGMRADLGAIDRVEWTGESFRCHVIGNSRARGLCGSGLVDAVAAGLTGGLILPTGRLRDRVEPLALAEGVGLRQQDIRELQLAKGAIAAGLRLLADQRGCGLRQLERTFLCGAFGNSISPASARRIGLIHAGEDTICPLGNAALLGARMVLLGGEPAWDELERLQGRIAHRALGSDPAFMDTYVEEMNFPASLPLTQMMPEEIRP